MGDALPVKAELAVTAMSLATAAAYGFLVVLLFTLWPLGRAGQVRAGVLSDAQIESLILFLKSLD